MFLYFAFATNESGQAGTDASNTKCYMQIKDTEIRKSPQICELPMGGNRRWPISALLEGVCRWFYMKWIEVVSVFVILIQIERVLLSWKNIV